ncbi:hypothetical protein BKA70DRAFT_1565350 [Coprinopsis sp. MPI-PUGE-AT-0042]|nr:hypothetical protein BKA70DRAFT_1565350 [Coprinopsis sp. MPI-PUGE-AT-0042]
MVNVPSSTTTSPVGSMISFGVSLSCSLAAIAHSHGERFCFGTSSHPPAACHRCPPRRTSERGIEESKTKSTSFQSSPSPLPQFAIFASMACLAVTSRSDKMPKTSFSTNVPLDDTTPDLDLGCARVQYRFVAICSPIGISEITVCAHPTPRYIAFAISSSPHPRWCLQTSASFLRWAGGPYANFGVVGVTGRVDRHVLHSLGSVETSLQV